MISRNSMNQNLFGKTLCYATSAGRAVVTSKHNKKVLKVVTLTFRIGFSW